MNDTHLTVMKHLPKVFPFFLVIVFFFLSLFLYSKLAGPIPFSLISTVTNKTDVFSVSGEGKVVAKPDIAYVSVGIEKSANTVEQAQIQINEVNQKIVEGLKKLGINAEKDIKTESYLINPNFDWNSGRQKITGYTASTNLSVKVKKIGQINDVIDAATNGGANRVSGISFDVEDKEKLQETARQDAVAQAKRKAEQAAKAAGFKLGRIINYSESAGGVFPQPLYNRADLKVASESPATEIQTGSQEIKITVSLSYQIE